MKASVLIVDDEEAVCESLTNVLQSRGYPVQYVLSGGDALEVINNTQSKKSSPEIVFLDLQLPDFNGIEVLKKIKAKDPAIKVIMITGYGDINKAVEAMREGASDFLLKPCNLEDVIIRLEKVLEGKKVEDTLNYYHSKVIGENECIVGPNLEMQKIYDDINRLASSSSSTVLIQGETGTGKELIAKRIHMLSPRKLGPYVVVNAAALSGDLLESELFGHEAGSFTGALKKKKGLFEVANQGTLVLDEIGEMPMNLQAKLLRSLQDNMIRRVGGVDNIHVDIRLVTSTNANLDLLIKEKAFRQDLFYRLNVVSINLPPLRNRLDDLPSLVDFFVKQYTKEFKLKIKKIHPEVMILLKQYSWPGNIRELKNFIERMLLLQDFGEEILPKHVQSLDIQSINDQSEVSVGDSIKVSRDKPDMGWVKKVGKSLSLESIERGHITDILKSTSGNKNQAAQILGIDRTTLYNKLKKYQI